MSILNIAVIGSGTSGLCAAKHALQEGFDVTIYDQNENLGGIWLYTDRVGKDQYGVETHTAMYQGLRTNLPHQLMEFPDFPYPERTKSYPPQPEVLKYLNAYADKFDLKNHIKVGHLVIRVLPIEKGQWEVIVKDLPNNTFDTKIYDAIFVANGHYSAPRIPNIDGLNEFKGKCIHSHDFRTAEAFKDDKVLVIGGGSSGRDLVEHISKTAERLTWSQNERPHETKEAFEKRKSLLPPKVTLQNNVKRFTATGAEFLDGTHEIFTVILFATGYNYKYPFLSVDTGIHVDDNFVTPLYKQIINIEHPTMVFIGIPFTCATTQTYDLQVRFALRFISGAKILPTKADMLIDMWAQCGIHWNKGYRKRYTHSLGPEQKDYYKQLADIAKIENIPDVIAAMHFDARATAACDPAGFRKYKYIIQSDKSFTKVLEEE